MNKYTLHQGDSLHILTGFADNSIDAIITDGPYGLDFMGKHWDYGVPGVEYWREALRVAKPGAMLFAFGGTRTVHRLAVAIEDAGWMIRDRIQWIYGSGFPKSHNISKGIDKAAGVEREVVGRREVKSGGKTFHGADYKIGEVLPVTAPATPAAIEWDGYGTALKPAHEPIIVAMKPLDGTFAENALKWGVAGLWIDGGRVGTEDRHNSSASSNDIYGQFQGRETQGRETQGRWPANIIHDGSEEVLRGFPESNGQQGDLVGHNKTRQSPNGIFGEMGAAVDHKKRKESDTSAARFFYCAKASKAERNAGLDKLQAKQRDLSRNAEQPSMNGGEGNPYNRGAVPVQNHHPTVKPVELLRYLARLVKMPTKGTLLDMFNGSGSMGVAAILEGFDYIGIDKEADYLEITDLRCQWAQAEAERERIAAANKAGGFVLTQEEKESGQLGLFS